MMPFAMSSRSLASHRLLAANGIELHVAKRGEGRPVLLLHGFPELWYSWRHQLPAIADAGFRAIAPDLRGYGDSSIPDSVEAYDLDTLALDCIGLLDALGEQQAVFVGHDWGSAVAWHAAIAHPDRVRAVVSLSVPFVPRAPAAPVDLMRQALGPDFYIVWFQEPGVADQALARDVRRTLATTKQWTSQWGEGDDEPRCPGWMTEQDLHVYVEAFERTGFTGGLNYYRNIDRNWARSAHLAKAHVEQPALLIAGSRDPVRRFIPIEVMDGWVDDLRGVITVEGAGHWLQQQRPEEVNDALIEFLTGVEW
jgi:pimeloyl-ACP methyl ester carboxylesterase